jgi:hypothetical protein
VADGVFGDEHADGVSWAISVNVAYVVEKRSNGLSVGRVDNLQVHWDLTCAPFVGERLRLLLVDVNDDRGQCAGWVARAEASACRVGRMKERTTRLQGAR